MPLGSSGCPSTLHKPECQLWPPACFVCRSQLFAGFLIDGARSGKCTATQHPVTAECIIRWGAWH